MNDAHERIGRHWLHGGTIRLTMADGVVKIFEQLEPPATRGVPDKQRWIAPALIDLQLNGVDGVDFNELETTPQRIEEAVRYLYARGVVRFCPTVITSDQSGMLRCIRTIAEACDAYPEVAYAVLGIHVEGPYISGESGPRGAHPLEHVRDPDVREYLGWQEASGGRVRMVTVAPERTGAADFIRRLVSEGVVAAIGHTGATDEQLLAAVDAGASMSTHLGNGSHPLLPRHPNYIWSQLAEDRLYAGLIGDGHHLPPAALKSMIRAKGTKAVIVSDATHYEGFAPGRYMKRGRYEVLLRPDGRLVMADHPQIFAGAATALNRCVENVARFGICSLGEAIEMASLRPAEVIGLSQAGLGSLRPGSPADLIVYETGEDGRMEIVETIAGGRSVFTNSDR
ncbi:MAG: N-acetylglucosamine-6-phosphate deacetylase [Paenibacillus sp.]|nr:N-acetylglucosamine-6-phosphate deacetylase [Paenibacillus sp.]